MDPVLLIAGGSAFVATLALVYGAVSLFREWGGDSTERRLKSLLRGDHADSEAPSLLKESRGWIEQAFGRVRGLATTILTLNNLFEQAGVPFSTGAFLAISGGTAVVGLAASILLRAPAALVPAIVCASALLPFFWLLRRRARRFKRFAQQLPNALELLARALRAGHSLPSAMTILSTEMLPPIAGEFRRIVDEQALGRSIDQSLQQLVLRIPNEDLRFFATAVKMQQRCGGNLAEILDKISAIVRERFRIMGQVQALTGEGRMSGAILLAMPIAIFLTVYALSPEYMLPLFNDPLGRKMTAVAAVLQLVGAFVIRQIVRIKA
jgi:tight adherence protein B